MRRVRSRFVAEILDADVGGPSPYIVTRYVPGQTLEDVVRQDGPLRGPALARVASGLAAAIAAVHAAGRGAPGSQARERDALRRAAGGDRLRHRAHSRLHPAYPDRHGDGHARLPGARGHRGPAEQRRVRRALVGGHGGFRRHRQAAVRGRDVPDDLLPRAAGEGGTGGRARPAAAAARGGAGRRSAAAAAGRVAGRAVRRALHGAGRRRAGRHADRVGPRAQHVQRAQWVFAAAALPRPGRGRGGLGRPAPAGRLLPARPPGSAGRRRPPRPRTARGDRAGGAGHRARPGAAGVRGRRRGAAPS